MMLSFFKDLTHVGAACAESKSERRNIILTNYVSLIIAAATFLLACSIFFFSKFSAGIFIRLLLSSFILLFPIVLNRMGLIISSRILVCWFPLVVVVALTVIDLKSGEAMSLASFVGVRLFLLAIGCFPFLVFNLSHTRFLFLALSGTVFMLLFFDAILGFFGVGYLHHNTYDPLYEFNTVRALISFMVISFSLYFLKRVVEQNESLNQKLLIELEEKNELIQRQAEDEVNKLNKQLIRNVQKLSEREFILQQSQRIAKIGSWEYGLRNSFTFWSAEMYNIFGQDHSFDIKDRNLATLMWGEESKVLIRATKHLLRSKQPFDLTIRGHNPLGYTKWVRVYAFPTLQDGRVVGMRGICHDVTHYKEAEDLLRKSENKYRSLFEQASDFIAILDFNGNFLDANASWCQAFGYTKEALQGMKIEALIDPEQLKYKPIMYEELQQGMHVLSQRRMMRVDKTIVYVEANVKKMQEGQMLVIARDVTKLREVQLQIELSEAKFRGAFEYSAIGMALVALDGKWLKVNKELCQLTGYAEQQLLLMRTTDITHPEEMKQDHELQMKLLHGQIDLFRREKRYLHQNGSIVWVNVNVSLIKDTDGSPLYYVAQVEDITLEKRAAEKLMLNEANLNATINNTDLMIWSVDRNFNLLMFNTQFFNYMKNTYGVLIEAGSKTFVSLPATEAFELTHTWTDRYQRVLAGERIRMEERHHEIDFQYSLSPILEAGQVIGVSIFAENVTERKASERALAEAQKKIGELRLMALRSVMSPHFIFNVLNSIQFFIAKNDRLNAINYLSTFSKLVRSILTHSVNTKIKLTDEIEMLQNYIQLEMTRFENKFTFTLTIDPELEVDSVVIPSLLIQPYVENAIIHGLYNKQATGKLSIKIQEQKGILYFEIEDDGIGREAAMKLRKKIFPSHTSMGIQITEERLKLINQVQDTAFEIEDLMNDNGPCGTRIKIGIRL